MLCMVKDLPDGLLKVRRGFQHPGLITGLALALLFCVLASQSPGLHQWLHPSTPDSNSHACHQGCSPETKGASEENPGETEEHHCSLSILAVGYVLPLTGLEGWKFFSYSGNQILETSESVRISLLWLSPSNRAPPAA